MRSVLRMALLGSLLVSGAPAAADRFSDCSSAKPDIRIRACTDIIKFPRHSGRRISSRDVALAYNNRGAAFADKGDRKRAIADYNRAFKLSPKQVQAYVNRGIAHGENGDHELAIADFDTAIELSPKFANAYYNRGLTYGDRGDHDRAIADFAKVIKLDPKDANAYFQRGLAYEAKGNRGLAIAEYDTAIELDPHHGYAYCRRASVRSDQASVTTTLSVRRQFLEQVRADWRSAVAKIPGGDKWHDTAKTHLGLIEKRLASLDDPASSETVSSVTSPKPGPSSSLNPKWSDRTVCILALDAEKLSVGANARPEVVEFSRRGLSVEKCRATLGLSATRVSPKPVLSSSLNPNWSDRTVCILALDAGKLSVGVNTRPEVVEFSRRDLSVEKCRISLGLPAISASLKPGPFSSPDINRSDRTVCIPALNAPEKLSVDAGWRLEVQEISLRVGASKRREARELSPRSIAVRQPAGTPSRNTMAIRPADD